MSFQIHIDVNSPKGPFTCEYSSTPSSDVATPAESSVSDSNLPVGDLEGNFILVYQRDLTHIITVESGGSGCPECPKVFYSRKSLTDHTRRHINMRLGRFKCKFCDQIFAALHEQTIHERVHTCEQPYSCDTCNHCFTSKSNLVQHKRVHTGEKRHTCHICLRAFSQGGNMRRHISKAHP